MDELVVMRLFAEMEMASDRVFEEVDQEISHQDQDGGFRPDQGDAFIKAVGGLKNTEGVLVPNDGWWPQVNSYQNSEFVQLITSKFHLGPADISSDSVQAFSVGQVLQQAVQKAQSLDNGKIMDTLRHTTFQSLQGPVQFSSDGQNTASVAFLFQWQKGNLIPVYPQSQAAANVEYPKPAWVS